MTESTPSQKREGSEQEQAKLDFIALAHEIIESQEKFPFPGINPESYNQMKADEAEFPGYTTPVDELIERLKIEGMKVVFGKNPESGNVYILPGSSDNIEEDALTPRQLIEASDMSDTLKRLIAAAKN